MGVRNSSGFTIIETMLFLAVTGLLIVGVLIGTGSSLANQRYRDSVETFKNVIQAQYSELGSVRNSRDNAIECQSDATITDGSDERGQSDCLMVGRYMLVSEGDITIYSVLARERTGATTSTNDITNLRNNYYYNTAADVERHTMEWGAEVAWPSSGRGAHANTTPSSVGLLFITSPDSGRVYTFTSDSVMDAGPPSHELLTTMINALATQPATGRGERTMCVEAGGLISGGNRSVYLTPRASSASSVEVRSNETTEDVQC